MNKTESDEILRMRGKGVPFERIHRITGYLVHDIRFWNNAKKEELKDRTKNKID